MGMMDQQGQMPQQMPQQGGMMQQQAQPQVNTQEALQIVGQVAQNPTPEAVGQLIQYIQQLGLPDTQEVIQQLDQIKDQPQQLQQYLQMVMQKLGE